MLYENVMPQIILPVVLALLDELFEMLYLEPAEYSWQKFCIKLWRFL